MARKFSHRNKTEAVARAMRSLLDADARRTSLFGAHPGSVRVREGVDLAAPARDPGRRDRARDRPVSDALLLDTHIALWLDSGGNRLPASKRLLIDGCWQKGGTIRLSAVSVWEIALLVDNRRIELDGPVDAWVERFLERPGLEAVPLGDGAAGRSYRLHPFEHRDPADRLLIATAIELGCPLVTCDQRILRFAADYGGQHAFTVVW